MCALITGERSDQRAFIGEVGSRPWVPPLPPRRPRAPSAPPRSPRPSGSRPRTIPTASPSARRTTRCRSTWSELRDRVDALARGLHELGVRRGDTVALMLGNRPEFHIADLAAMTLGATPFSIYATSSPEQITYVVGTRRPRSRSWRRCSSAQFRSRPRANCRSSSTVIAARGLAGRGHARLGRRRGHRVRPRRRGRLARGRARGPDHADLHLRHHRPAEGRAARAPQPDGGDPGRRAG